MLVFSSNSSPKGTLTIFTKPLTYAVSAILLLASTVSAQSTKDASVTSAAAITERQSQWLRSPLDERIRLAERLGEEGAEAFARQKGYEPLLRNGDKALKQGFDQVYRTKDGAIVVIEAKGGTSSINRAYGCQQGTPEWAVQAAKRVTESSVATSAERQAAQHVLEAAKQGNLTVQVVRTRHVLGEPTVAVLESSLKVGPVESKVAATILKELGPGAKGVQAMSKVAKTTEAASVAATGSSVLSKAGKVAGVAGIAIDGYVRVNSAIETENKFKDGTISQQEREKAHAKNAAGTVGGWTGALAGAKLGSLGGGAVGTVVAPGPGSLIGSFLGGVSGGIAGYFGGEVAAESVASWAVQKLHDTGTTISEVAADSWNWTASKASGAWNWMFGK